MMAARTRMYARCITIGVPKEIKKDEYRVGMVPSGVDVLVAAGHKVIIEKDAGEGSSLPDDAYKSVGATIAETAEEVYAGADMIVKVKEPLEPEFDLVRPNQTLFTYFHLAAGYAKPLIRAMQKSGATCIAYETIEDKTGGLPLLVPMSAVAGRMAIQQGAKYLEKPFHGRGILLSGVAGVPPANVLVIGGGIVGTEAAKIAAGQGAIVTLLDTNLERLQYLSDIMPDNVITVYSTPLVLRKLLPHADLVIGAVLLPGARCPKLIKKEDLLTMKKGACFVDVAIDQGGIAETSRPTYHTDPTYTINGVNHYCVANIPGAVPSTSTMALTNATLPYILNLANNGWKSALRGDPGFMKGLNIAGGKIFYPEVAESISEPCADISNLSDLPDISNL